MIKNSDTTEFANGITAIDTGFIAPQFDASHLIIADGRAAFVDTGVNDSVPVLLEALAQKQLDLGDVDFVFLTHVHLDHAGGAGQLMQSLPNASAVLHPRGAPHMIDPSKLIKGAQTVYGEAPYAEMYGDIVPIDAERVLVIDDEQVIALGGRELRCLFTEGHARHHYCLADAAAEAVFTGDSFGISYRQLDSERGEFIYPTTTPVHFDPPEAHKSIDRIMGERPRHLYLTHFSRVSDLERLAEDMHTRIDDFVAMARRYAGAEKRTAKLETAMFDYFRDAVAAHGLQLDDTALHAIVDTDVRLNTMGLEFWLEKG